MHATHPTLQCAHRMWPLIDPVLKGLRARASNNICYYEMQLSHFSRHFDSLLYALEHVALSSFPYPYSPSNLCSNRIVRDSLLMHVGTSPGNNIRNGAWARLTPS